MLSGYGNAVMAVFAGEVTQPNQPSTMSIVIGPDEFELTKGAVMLGFHVNSNEGSGLTPQPATVRDASGKPVKPIAGQTQWNTDDQSLVLVALGYGTYQVEVMGANGTTGAYELATSLVGDVNGDRHVNKADGKQLRSVLNTSADSPDYDIDADVNQDGRVTGFDLSLHTRNRGTSTSAAVQLSFEIDPALMPNEPDTGRLVDSSGIPVDFSTKELILMTSDAAKLDAFIDKYDGELLKTYDPQEYGVAGLEKIHVVKIDASAVDEAQISKDLKSVDPNAQGAHKVSSQKALKVLAVAAKEIAAGNKVAVNWKGKSAQFLDRTTVEAPIASGGSFDAFTLPHLAEGDTSNQDIGVAEAWRVLELGGQLDERVDIAILDQGFSQDSDWPFGLTALSTVPGVPALGTPASGDSPWHGTNVVSAAMAVPDNAFGSAGPAGPVARPITIATSLDFVTSIASVLAAAGRGADIINMSYGARVPAAFSFTVGPFDLTTLAVRSQGTLIFAAAGNDNENIDARESVFGIDVWEKAWHTPAENSGVIAVGALSYNSQARASFSNFGNDQLDIYAPGVVEVGPDPSNPGNIVRIVSGTSSASPFAAGVAALIWAADPSLSASGVENILYETAVKNPHVSVHQYVNALDAVLAAIGDVPPYVKITNPASGSSFSRGVSVPLVADREDYEDGLLNVVWSSDREVGDIGSSPAFLSYGIHEITATVTDSAGQSASDSITIEITNEAPVVELVTPEPGAIIYTGNPTQFSATSQDFNEPSQMLDNADMVWTSNIDGHLGFGHSLFAPLTTPGEHLISIEGTDSQGESARVIFNVHVLEPVGGLPEITFLIPMVEDPSQVVIFLTGSDANGWYADVRLVANATDPEDGQLHGASLQWTMRETENGPQESIGEGDVLEFRIYVDEQQGGFVYITLTATDSDGQPQHLTLTIRLFGLI